MKRNSLRLLMAVALMATAATPALGHDGSSGDPPHRGPAPRTELPNDGDAFSGPTWIFHADEDACPAGEVCTEHYSSFYHYHYVTGITGTYDGYYDYSTGYGCTGPCTAENTMTMSWTNKWYASIGFDHPPVSGAVGFDVTYTSSQSFSFSFPVPAGQTKVIRYKDWYHVKNLSLRTDYLSSAPPYNVFQQEYGTGWGGAWYQRIFYAQSV